MTTRLLAVLAVVMLVAAACASAQTENLGDSSITSATSTPVAAASVADTATAPEADAQTSADVSTDEQSADDAPAAPPASWDIDAALAADPNCSTPVTGDPFRIGYAADFSEIGGPADIPGSQAALHMADLINCSGGLDGRPIEVIVADVSGEAATTRRVVLDLLDQGVQALIGPPFGDHGFRVLQATQGEVAVLFAGSTEPALADSELLAFLVAFNDTQGAIAAADFALSQGWDTAVTFSSPGPYFGYNPAIFDWSYQASGGRVLNDFEFVPLETQDFSAAIAEIAEGPPDVIYSAMFASQMAALSAQLTDAGLDIELIQSDVFDRTGGVSVPGTEGIFHVTHGFPAEGSRLVALGESIVAATGEPSPSPNFSALAADAVSVIIEGYYAAGQVDDPVAIGRAIEDLSSVQGVTGELSYDGTGLPEKPIFVQQVVNGESVLIQEVG